MSAIEPLYRLLGIDVCGMSKNNTNPSLHAFRKILELHRFVRYDLYQTIVKNIIIQHVTTLSS